MHVINSRSFKVQTLLPTTWGCEIHITYVQRLSSGIPWNIPRVTYIFSVYTQAFRRVLIPRKFKWSVGYPMVYHERALHNYFIPCHWKYSDQHNECDIRAAHDGKVGCNTVQYTTAFRYSDWLYSLWHGLKKNITNIKVPSGEWTCFAFDGKFRFVFQKIYSSERNIIFWNFWKRGQPREVYLNFGEVLNTGNFRSNRFSAQNVRNFQLNCYFQKPFREISIDTIYPRVESSGLFCWMEISSPLPVHYLLSQSRGGLLRPLQYQTASCCLL